MLIGQLARRADLPISTVRYYERAGLLSRPGRTAAGYRVYTTRAVVELALIRDASALGFSQRDVRLLLDIIRRGDDPCARLQSLAESRLALMSRELAAMQSRRDELQRAVQSWRQRCTFDPRAADCDLGQRRGAGGRWLKSGVAPASPGPNHRR